MHEFGGGCLWYKRSLDLQGRGGSSLDLCRHKDHTIKDRILEDVSIDAT